MSNKIDDKSALDEQHLPMTRLEASTRVVGSLAWPLTIFVLLVLFKGELTSILNRITKVEYPGGSVTVSLDRIQAASDHTASSLIQESAAAELVKRSLSRAEGDPLIALTRIRFDLEEELFRPSKIGLSPPIAVSRTTFRRIDDLVDAGLLDTNIARNVREFSEIVTDVTQAERSYSNSELQRAIVVGADLVTEVRRRIVGAELEHNFESNLLWSHTMRPDIFPGGMLSAVAATVPDFEYDFDLYRTTVESFNLKELNIAMTSSITAKPELMKALSLEEFVQVLEFREQEIMRVLREERKPPNEREPGYQEWNWPKRWGEIGWGGPILRRAESGKSELHKLQSALALYRERLAR